MKQHIILFFLVLLSATSCNTNTLEKTEFGLSENEEKALVALGQLWGFLKYHHPAVAKGDYDWDAELIKLIPLILESEDKSQWEKILDNWLDSLPHVAENSDKKLPDRKIKIKPNYGELFNTEYFYPETIGKIKYILDNAVITTSHYAMRSDSNFSNESAYEELLYPELSYRLLALFRYWNIINYFFPYRELCDQEWSTVLADMLPDFFYAKNQKEYIFACLKLATKIDDSHGFFNPNTVVFELARGLLKPSFETQFIENKLVVTLFTGNDTYTKEKIEIGDVITAIEGESVDDIVERMLPYTPASNYAVKLREISSRILRGNSDIVTITVQRNGNLFEVKTPCYDMWKKIPNYYNPHPEKEAYTILDNNIGYILPSNCKVEEGGREIKKVFDGTKGVIIDLRCYPSVYISFGIVNYLKTEGTKLLPHSQISNSDVSYPGYFFVSKKPQETKIPKYRTSNIVVIVNEYTQSQAEDHVLSYQTVPNIVVIGSTTAGANGRTVNFNLPGNIRTTMTGLGVYYPDGSDLQRVGVKIDEIVKPTIAGIKVGRDELLERAIEIINESSEIVENNKQK